MSKDKHPSIFPVLSQQKTQQRSTAKQRFINKGVQWLFPLCTGTPGHNHISTPHFSQHADWENIQSRDEFWPIERARQYLMDFKLWYFCGYITCSQKRTVFRERSWRKAVNFEQQMAMLYNTGPSAHSFAFHLICFYIHSYYNYAIYHWVFDQTCSAKMALFFFCVFLDLDSISVHRSAQKAILT